MSLSPDGKLVLAVTAGNTQLYELSGNRLAHFPGYPSRLRGFSPDSKLILTNAGGQFGSYLWDVRGKQVAHFHWYMTDFSKNGKFILVSDTQDSFLYTLTGNLLTRFRGAAGSFSPDGNFVLTQVTSSGGYR